MPDTCAFCALLQAPRDDPTFITEFEHCVAFLDFDQNAYPGESILVLKQHHEHLHQTPIDLQTAVIPEINTLTTAILQAYGGFRANHLSLGNQVAHLHWHIVPRYSGDRNAGSSPKYDSYPKKLSDGEYRETARRIRLEIGD